MKSKTYDTTPKTDSGKNLPVDVMPTVPEELLAALTEKQRVFWRVYEKTGNASQAYREAYPTTESWTPGSVAVAANNMLANAKIQLILKFRNAVMADSLTMDAKEIVKHWVEIATADPSKIVKTRRVNCRHCHGIGFAYRWRNTDEWANALAEAMDRNAKRQEMRDTASPKEAKTIPADEPLPSLDGGVGFKRPHKPHPDCPKCDGEGYEDVFIADMDSLTGPERRLIAGVKKTEKGIEVKLRDQDRSLENIAKVLTLFGERREHSGPGGGPIPVAAAHFLMPQDPVQAARAYDDYINGKTPALPAPEEPKE